MVNAMLLTKDLGLVVNALTQREQTSDQLLTLLTLLMDSLTQESFEVANGLTQHYFILFLTYTIRLVHLFKSLAPYLSEKQS